MTTPRCTYRIQLTDEFTLKDTVAVLDYLDDLGVDAVYLSPVLTSTRGSTHGYDCTDPTTIDAALRQALVARFADGAGFRLLYGGSVKPGNAAEIFAIADVDGALVGGASLKAADFAPIVKALDAA